MTGKEMELLADDVYDFLWKMRKVAIASLRLSQRIAEIESRLEALGYSFDAPPSGVAQHDRMADGVAELVEARRNLADYEARTRSAFERAASLCDDGSWALALWMNVVEREPWRKIAALLGYSESYTRSMAKKQGVRRIAKTLANDNFFD